MGRNRFDETWHRLREWTKGQTPSERLAAQILNYAGFQAIDPHHPLGGKDGGRDATALKDGKSYAVAVYFPRGQKRLKAIAEKFNKDLASAKSNKHDGIAFVTNQEISLADRTSIKKAAGRTLVELYHLERVTMILDTPGMDHVREQFLDITPDVRATINLGGQGGLSPGAGGGGGGAIGANAKAGNGGKGGRQSIFGSEADHEELLKFAKLHGGANPGAGGGGEGVVGDGAIAGDGGDGGDITSGELKVEPGDTVQIEVGEGGITAGQDGGHSIVRVYSKDGDLKQTIISKGGRGANAQDSAEISKQDLIGGFQISTLLPVNSADFSQGLLNISGGGWSKYHVPRFPIAVVWPIVCSASWISLSPQTSRHLELCITNPQGIVTSRAELQLSQLDAENTRYNWIQPMNLKLDSSGKWAVRVQSGDFTLARIDVQVTREGE